MAYFDEAGRPVRDKDGYIGVTTRYDERGKLVEETALGLRPRRAATPEIMAGYDERGNSIEEAYFDEQAGPPGTRTATPGWTAKYDERGNQTE